MNLKQVAAYVLNVPEKDIKWAKRDKDYRRKIYGRSHTLGYFLIKGEVFVK